MNYQFELAAMRHRRFAPSHVFNREPAPRMFNGPFFRYGASVAFQRNRSSNNYNRFISRQVLPHTPYTGNFRFRRRNPYDEVAESKLVTVDEKHQMSSKSNIISSHENKLTWMPANEWEQITKKDNNIPYSNNNNNNNTNQQDERQIHVAAHRCPSPNPHSCVQLHPHIAFGKKKKHNITNEGLFFCHACNMSFSPQSAFIGHMKSESHKSKKQLLAQIRLNKAMKIGQHSTSQTQINDKSLWVTTTQTVFDNSKSPEKKDNSLAVSGKKQYYCNICEETFRGDVIEHRRTAEHKANKAMARPFCAICKQFFRTPSKFVLHCKTPTHQEARKLHKKSSEIVPDVDGDNNIGEKIENNLTAVLNVKSDSVPTMLKNETEDQQCKAIKIFESENTNNISNHQLNLLENIEGNFERVQTDGMENQLSKTNTLSTVTPQFQSISTVERCKNESIDNSFIVPVTGFFCRLCNEFFETHDKAVLHCQSEEHQSKIKDN